MRKKRVERVERVGPVLPLSIVTAVFLVLVFYPPSLEFLLRLMFPTRKEVLYPRAGLPLLLGEHLVIVLVSSVGAAVIGTCIGIFATRPSGAPYRGLLSDLASLAQTLPPVAVLALAVPLMGFGFKPTILALFLYSILPVLRNSIAGLEQVSPELKGAAVGMGMTGMQILMKVEIPLALRVMFGGIRTSIVINVGTATVGAVVGAGGLGAPIISGLVRENPAFVLQGALAAGFLAFLIDQYLAGAERRIMRTYGMTAE
jgi:osmoprotectant transport system permease protein